MLGNIWKGAQTLPLIEVETPKPFVSKVLLPVALVDDQLGFGTSMLFCLGRRECGPLVRDVGLVRALQEQRVRPHRINGKKMVGRMAIMRS